MVQGNIGTDTTKQAGFREREREEKNYWCPLKNRDTALNNRFIGKYAVIRFGALGFRKCIK